MQIISEKVSGNGNGHYGKLPWNAGLSYDTNDSVKQLVDNSVKTKIERYGSAFPNNNMNEEHKKKIGDANRGRYVGHVWISNGVNSYHVSPSELEKYDETFEINCRKINGWVYVPWNKGKKGIFSEESRRKMSESAKHRPPVKESTRRKCSIATQKKLDNLPYDIYCIEIETAFRTIKEASNHCGISYPSIRKSID